MNILVYVILGLLALEGYCLHSSYRRMENLLNDLFNDVMELRALVIPLENRNP